MKIAPKVFRFDRYELDLGRYDLRRAGRRVPLSRMPMEFLILLVEERGNLVSREKIATHLWPDAGSVDVVQGTNAAVKRIRAVLNDDAAKPRFIETVVGKGYRFIAQVEELDAPPHLPAVPETLQIYLKEPAAGEALADETAPRGQAPWRKRVAVFLLAAGCATFWYWEARPAASNEPVFSQITSLVPENRATAAAISPDGRLVAYANVDGIFIRAKNGETSTLPAPSEFTVDRLAWFPDGTKLLASGFSRLTNVPQIWTVFVTGASPRLVRSNAREGSPSPDGTQVVSVSQDRSEIWVMGDSGENPVRIAAGPGKDTFPLVFWSPDGRRVAFQRRHYAPERHRPNFRGSRTQFDIYYDRSYESLDLTTAKTVAKVPEMWMNSAAALPDGRVLFLRWDPPGSDSVQLWEMKTNLATGAFLGAPRKVASQVEQNQYLQITGMSASTDGRQVLVLKQSNQNAVFVGDFSSSPPRIGNIRRLTLDERTNYPHAWTRDSRAVIFESDRSGNYDLYKQDVDKRTPDTILATPLMEVLPQMTADGRWVLYDSRAPGARQLERKLMRVPLEGGTPEEVPIGGWLDEFRCALGPGKGCVLRTGIQNQFYVFYDLDPIRGKGRELARTKWIPEYVADWDISPDGTQVAIPNHDSRSARIRVITLRHGSNPPSERELVLKGLTDLSGLVWAADGQGWFVSVDTTVGNRLLSVRADGRLHSLGDIQGWAVPSPDGRRIAFLNRIIATNAWLIERR